MIRDGAVAPKERVSITYRAATGNGHEDRELPLKLLMLGDWIGRADATPMEDRKPIRVTRGNFPAVMQALKLVVEAEVPDHAGGDPTRLAPVRLRVVSLADFTPAAIVAQVPALQRLVARRDAIDGVVGALAAHPAFAARVRALTGDPGASSAARDAGRADPADEAPVAEPVAGPAPVPAGLDREGCLAWALEALPPTGRGAASAGFAEALAEAIAADAVGGMPDADLGDGRCLAPLIADLDARAGRHIDAVLHHPAFQRLEARWRGLWLVVDRADPDENIAVELLNAAKADLLADFEDAPQVVRSGLYRLVYANEFGQFGGEPYAALIADYGFTASPQDLALLAKLAAVAAMAHAPFIAAAEPAFFGLDDHAQLPALGNLAALLDGPQYAKWRAFRDHDDARNIGLALPRILMRAPYAAEAMPVARFTYREDIDGRRGNLLWGSAAFAFATRLTDSFARYRWCPNIIGPRGGGAVDGLPLHAPGAMARIAASFPAEVMLSERREFDLAECGFIPVSVRPDSGTAVFISANSCQRPRTFARDQGGLAAETSYRLGTQLPYLFVVCRLAHYLKVLQREQIGTWKERADLERELNRWVSRFVVDMEDPSPAVRARKPLRGAQVAVDDVPGEGGLYRIRITVRPHFLYMGTSFALSLAGRIERTTGELRV